jgi:2-C-methyl-D-erythritol 4-phosphate cytidylyltransferase
MYKHQKVGAVIVAAGTSSRMGGIDKMFAPLEGKPVLARVLSAFEKAPSVDRVAIALNAHNIERGQKLAASEDWQKVDAILPGGLLRQDSVLNGLNVLSDCRWIIVHDGARPLVTVELIEEGIEQAQETGAAICAVPVTDTVKEERDGFVSMTIDRGPLRAVQTPQVFRSDIIMAAYAGISPSAPVTDDSALVESSGHLVKIYPGDYTNIKITTPSDLVVAGVYWRRREC